MTIADPCRHQMESLLAGELGASEREAVLRHAQTCGECRSLLEVDVQLRQTQGAELLDAREGRQLRAAVLEQLRGRSLGTRTAERSRGPLRSWSLGRIAAGLAALLLLTAGFTAGRFWTPAADDTDAALVGRIQRVVRQNRTLADVENSRYVFTGVSFRELDSSRVAVGFDVTTHVDLVAQRSDPLVRELVIQAVLAPSPVGSRLKAIAYAESLRDREVKQALRIAMLNDPSVAVQLKALSTLASYKQDPDVQSTFLDVLKTSDSVQMRLLAIDYLVESRVDPTAMRNALRDLSPTGDSAALLKANAYLQ